MQVLQLPLHEGAEQPTAAVRREHADPRHARARRPEPRPGDVSRIAWASWLDVLDGQDVAPDDPRAIIRRRMLDGDVPHGSSSVSLIASSGSHFRYDFATVRRPPLPLHAIERVLEART